MSNSSNLVRLHFGEQSSNTVYSYADILRQHFYTTSIGGEVLDDYILLKQQLQNHPFLKIDSPDAIEYVFQELKQATTTVKSPSGTLHAVNEYYGFNSLLPALYALSGNKEKKTAC